MLLIAKGCSVDDGSSKSEWYGEATKASAPTGSECTPTIR